MGRKEKDRTEEQFDIAPDFNGSVQKQTEALTEMELNLKEGAQNSGGDVEDRPTLKEEDRRSCRLEGGGVACIYLNELEQQTLFI